MSQCDGGGVLSLWIKHLTVVLMMFENALEEDELYKIFIHDFFLSNHNKELPSRLTTSKN